ncbi:N-acetylmuramoyl-L-alanine amidase [Cereibacter sphaeroides]|uniref:transporter substrate-binding protein n=1 Tax=Cereibacter sphaeroides TaxID=1063 RepID=UPI000E5B90F4|nr:transporter substrate-binding protein [Cereibacter sphaeroides]RHZ96217.1 N-acetylmuramoyl-L-alanine amidase [Cereibacter sphaeroides]
MKRRIDLGLLYSRSGSYALISDACRTGALAAVAEVNAGPFDLELVPVERDPGGNIDLYAPLCEELLAHEGLHHVVGCVTSWSRKEVIPTLEKARGTLWYAVPYEGFEASDHVVYTHACPNQHLLPLLDWAFPAFGRRAYLTGSNYIWGWEMNRLARERIGAAGGKVLGERYLPIGSLEIDRMIEEIRATEPDFILNSLIGPSSYAFLKAYHALGCEDARFSPDRCPVMSCNLTECELPALGDAAEGLIAAGPYFRGEGRFGSSHEAAAHAAVMELARLLSGRPGAERLPLSQLLAEAPPGIVDPQTHHTSLPVLISQVSGGRFTVRERLPARPGDPYLTHPAPARPATLRIVS